jgi:hypothetical protein
MIPCSEDKKSTDRDNSFLTQSLNFDKFKQKTTKAIIDSLREGPEPKRKKSDIEVYGKNPEKGSFSKEEANFPGSSYRSSKESWNESEHERAKINKDLGRDAYKYEKSGAADLQKGKLSDLTATSTKNYSDLPYEDEIYSPIRVKKARDYLPSNDQKPTKDIRQVRESKTMKNVSGYFTNKKVSLYDFELKKALGEGKFGTVYQAFHK